MRDLDLRMESNEPEGTNADAVQAVVVSSPSAPRATATDLAEAHEMLLKDLDEVRRVAQLVTERIAALDAKLATKEASLARQGEMLERVARESLAEASREWAETAQRFRKFVDDMGNLAAWQEHRTKKAADPWRPMLAAFLGALLAGLFVIWATGPRGERFREWIAGERIAPTIAAPDDPSPAKGNKPAVKGSAR